MALGIAMGMLGAIGFSGKAIIVKLAYRHGVDTVTFLMLRMLLALPFFMAMVWWTQHRKGAAPVHLRLREWLGVVWLGFCGYYLASFLDFAGLQYVSASMERLILYLYPTLVLLLGIVLYGKRASRYQWMGMAVSYAGVVAVFVHEVHLSGADSGVGIGAALVFGSAVSYALYLSYSGELVGRLGALRLVGLASCVACVLCVGQFALLRPVSLVAELSADLWWLSVVNASLCTVLPVLLVMLSIERIGSALASQAGMVGPMSTLVMAALVLDEPLSPWLLLGTALVMSGVFICSRTQAHAGSQPPSPVE
ncbi:MAG: DMT family transporter [Betaproteobacteria bacterium]|nr:DMT family transporter [Betaproteobacteria bacterium]